MRSKKFIIQGICVILVTANLFAGDIDRIGTVGGAQVLVPVGGRALAMGGADLAKTVDLEAIYWNPAGLSSMGNKAVGIFSTMNILSEIRVNYLAIGFQAADIGTIGFSLKAFNFGDIAVTTIEDMDGESGQTYSPSLVTIGLTFSRKLTDAIQVGVNGKLISESIPRTSASAFAFDAGIQYHGLAQIQGLSLGLVVKNIGTDLTYSGTGLLKEATETELGFEDSRSREIEPAQLPSTVELGLSYSIVFSGENNVIISSTFQNNNFGTDQLKTGFEYGFQDLVFLRAGYLYTDKLKSQDVMYTFTAGFGFHQTVGGVDLTIDYAYRDSRYFNGNNLFSLQIGF